MARRLSTAVAMPVVGSLDKGCAVPKEESHVTFHVVGR